MAPLNFHNKVAVVTGAGGGLGRGYALLLGSRGAKVVVNDLGGDTKGEGKSSRAADAVVEEIRSAGGTAVANYDSVEDGENIIQTALDNFGHIDILVNNAGILRDRSLPRTSNTDWDLVHRVHLRGSFLVTRAAFPVMKKQGFGRIIMTTSTAGIFGNFGQANYSAAKLGLLGLSNTVAIEGRKYNINCNTVAPFGGTRMTEDIMPPDMLEELKPEFVAPVVSWLCHEDCHDTGGLYVTGGGWVSKFRWENTTGVMCRESRVSAMTPETVRDNWDKICDFTNSENLESNEETTGSILEVLNNLKDTPGTELHHTHSPASTSPSTTGPLSALGVSMGPTNFTYTKKDAILYALGVGMSTQDEDGLRFLYENSEDFCPLPTFTVIPSQAAMMGGDLWSKMSNWSPDLTKLLHGEMYIENVAPIPPAATLATTTTVSDVLDKGSGSVLILDTVTRGEDGTEVSRGQWSLFLVGEGNFGGPRSSKVAVPLADPPNRPPDATKELTTGIDQAALYRLSGDYNPLHIDPSFAAMGGFSEPILHGLCFYGVTARAVLATYCDGQPSKFKAMKARFAKPVLPGQTLVVAMWKEGSRIHFTTTVKETGKACLTGGYVDIIEEAGTKDMAAGGKGAEAAGSEVFREMAGRLAGDSSVAAKVNAIIQWNVMKSDKTADQWTVDLKGEAAAEPVYMGPPQGGRRPDLTLTLTEENLVALVAGSLKPQAAFLSGQLKVAGNMAVAQRLQLLMPPQPRMYIQTHEDTMTDYKEEQNNEIEALESIYPEEFEILETDPYHKFRIRVKTEGGEDEGEPASAEISLTFQYTSNYPDQPPALEVTAVDNVEDDELDELRQRLDEEVTENLGMVMVFTVVTSALEWLAGHMEQLATAAQEQQQLQLKEKEEAERKKFEGTRVTVETFMAWKAKFDQEMSSVRTEQDRSAEKNQKLSGRQLFQTDQTLNQSDLSFLGDGEGEVAVDESLFQDLDDLDLEDELDDEDLED
ncbi:hypothetical protein Pmani_018617 [Petrolisthes manimaculis]|uniref:Peroxisomal multifunctional enzyme type 2 n=1 Tax=Petrolisthes manimaculis TaxID=1843537 RepID=A0AAE1U876_9EUCA|nr:hypothetical protein Pmani_018617 [Petrolisthes manimaculis]